MLNILFAETALELVPKEITRHPAVRRNAKKMGKNPEHCLLDRNLHHYAMLRLLNSEKRGRPDIIHFCLLEALGSPLNKVGKLTITAHTYDDNTINIMPEVRLPRDCLRFNNLMEQLLTEKQVPQKPELPLLKIEKNDIKKVKDNINPTKTIVLTSHGKLNNLKELCRKISQESKPLVIIGAYPTGPMDKKTLDIADEMISIYPETLEAWVITSRLIYEYEQATGII
ncbi:16S rRNA methyltransferase [Candidatus Bathyarchaeota archaeon]|nr:16S rRNA methyltransferase [Candidatus Bathyarchaeota archaeon]